MKEGVDTPDELIDISRLTLSVVRSTPDGGVSIGALAKNTETANHPFVRKGFPLLTQAILAGASAQIRNMATNGGNLMQRTRCPYFYDVATPCNKRSPGSGCSALRGLNRSGAVFGWNEQCVAILRICVALATRRGGQVQNANGKERSIKFGDFHTLPGNAPEKDNVLSLGELITSIEIPKNNFSANSYYLKLRDRASYAFALVSVAAALDIERSGKIKEARIALGGVAHKPWRAFDAEKFLVGKTAGSNTFKEAAEIAFRDAKPLSHNGFKIELGQRAVVRALSRAKNGGRSDV